ncbi:ATP adenylyltransferase [Vitiosangium sp. GDMCC 1.1324]|uniref:ATP adenylyltransferase family protein n=1 Tax=Vitiosangium sp. (strain GDMCC 1.1324) TaxID=2138576 RepID=UPI000D355549|nr:ATP adenylyltransferase [Vitiosangium sp. GDMCC 1.1324]PTL75259.1 ATP adenylyltransferase [Vitiosangium sp. GDMCC 1.1324]
MSTPPAPHRPLPQPEDLWPRTLETTRNALATGALQPIATECQTLEEREVPFQVRVLGRAHLKDDRAKREKPRAAPFNPFENPDPVMVVGDVPPAHTCMLNKFNVVEHHLLLVTRIFEEQESPLTAADFEALAFCMSGLDGLAFYNSGEMAGASQRHKHLQLIPPLGPQGLRAPMETLLSAPPARGHVTTVPALNFLHVLTGLGPWESSAGRDGARLFEAYQSLRATLGMEHALPPYNLLATRDWMLLVPRSCAETHGINVNAMGFAGSLLVKTPEQFQKLQELGPLELLRQVTPPARPTASSESEV